MTKNVTVTDANGNYIGTTYPKRARGLIKNGRALFVDDCTIRLSANAEPSDIYHTSEVTQMNTIYFNPRNWSFEQTPYNSQNSFVFSHTYGMNQGTGYSQPVRAERSFINDFDDSLVESLMFGHWDAPAVSAVSNEMSLIPDTEYRFVFWLNGGENDKSSEICQLRIIFSGNREDCYTYNLNRNYIKPLLHKDGWELYSIPFRTPTAASAMQGTSESAPTVATRLAFVAGNAPMAVKPAKEPDFYADWEDAPDAFASQRPQRHNLVFEDGWPSISQYGGKDYSTEALRAKKEAAAARCANCFSDSTLADDLAEHLEELEEQRDDLLDRAEALRARFTELTGRMETMTTQGLLTPDALDGVTGRISAFENELSCLENRVNELDQQVDNADCEIEMREMSSEDGDAYLDSLGSSLDAEDNHADAMEESLDSLEEYLDSLEDSAAE